MAPRNPFHPQGQSVDYTIALDRLYNAIMTIQELRSKKNVAIFQVEYAAMSVKEVINQYEADYQLFFEVLGLIPEDKKGERIFDAWGVNEIVAHVTHWNRETLWAIQAAQEGKIPWFFDNEDGIDAVNHTVAHSSQNKSPSSLRGELALNHTTLISFLQTISPDGFHQGAGKTWKGQKVTPSLVCSYRHYLAHAKDILNWLEENNA